MANITILLQHSGSWIFESDFANYKIDGILLRENATYNDLVDGISTQLGIDYSRKRMEIRYMMKGNVTPMEIRNEMGMSNNSEISFDQYTSMVEVGGDVGTVSVSALADNRSVNALCVLDSNSDHVM
ncbi:hypothetical protein H5410_012275 [Solanum commersonii]|uniref:Uncharacterized protein n=1 Tax=Solanum commersonii TaxID=4109 RepID=A0A9J6ARX9_SOLCO|nr:hypothetical protein H5410_012275 [Solanum commersonii]